MHDRKKPKKKEEILPDDGTGDAKVTTHIFLQPLS